MSGLKAPLSVQYEITWDCPHSCLHCYNHYRDSQACKIDQANELDWDRCQKILDSIIDAGIFTVILTGGEPLYRRDILYKVITYLKKAGIKVTLNTSAIMLKTSDIKKLEELGVDSLLISCPSMNQELYEYMVQRKSFKQFIRAMGLVANSSLRYTVNMVINNNNLYDLENTASQLFHNFGCRYFAATPMSLNACHQEQQEDFLLPGQVQDMIRRLVAIGQDLGIQIDIFEALASCVIPEDILLSGQNFTRRACTAGRTTATIGPDGSVRSCSHAPMSYGNLLRDGFDVIWQNMAPWRRNEYLPEKCNQCSYVKRCRGGCRISALAQSQGDLKAQDPWMQEPLSIIHPQKDINSDIDIDQSYVTKLFVWRKEGQDRYLIYNMKDKTILQINEEFFQLLLALQDVGEFCPRELIHKHGYKQEDFAKSLGVLWQRKLIATS